MNNKSMPFFRPSFFMLFFFLLGGVETTAIGEDAAETTTVPSEISEGLNPDAAFLARMSGIFVTDDPTSIYNFSVYDNEVEFILDGSWSLDFNNAASITFEGNTPVVSTSSPVFTQAVDLSSWVFLDKTWYFESSFAEEFTKNSVAAGYIGNDENVVKHVRVGNSGITFPDSYPFVEIGGGTVIAPGIMGSFAGDNWKADTIIRYDTSVSNELVLSGMNEVTDEYVSVTDTVIGKWFILPDEPVTGSVVVYVEDDSGSVKETSGRAKGRRWRKLNQSEFTVSGTKGTIQLDTAVTGSVAAIYTGGYATVGGNPGASLSNFVTDTRRYFDFCAESNSISLPTDYLPNPDGSDYDTELTDRFLISLDGETALLIRESGYFSPFEVRSRYEGDGTDADIVYEESGISPDYLSVTDYDNTYAEIYRTDTQSASDERSAESRFPLAAEFPKLYMSSFGGKKPDTDLTVRCRTYRQISTISLGTDVIPGTIQVRRSGVTDTAFTYNSNSGLLTLAKKPESTETIRITWMESNSAARNAVFTLGGGAEWNPLPSLAVTAATVFRWNISKNSFTDSSETSPGSFLVSTGLSYTGEGISASTAFAFDVSVADTTGYYRIIGMDDEPDTFYPDDDWYEPTPTDIEPVLGAPLYTDDTTPTAIYTDAAYRIELNGTSGDTLTTVSDSSVSGSVLAVYCDLPDSKSWSSAEIRSGTEGGADFRSAETVSIALKNAGENSDFEIFLQLGTGFSDYYEDPDTVRTWQLKTPTTNEGWVVRSITLADDDRSALKPGSDMRLIVMPSASATPTPGAPEAIRLRSGPLEINETEFTGQAVPDFTDDDKILLTEQYDSAATTLASAKPDIIQRFNTGEVNTVLSVQFTPESDEQEIIISRNIPALPLSSYRYISFFICPENLPSQTGSESRLKLDLGIPNTTGSGYTSDVTADITASALTAGVWQKVAIDLNSGTVSIDGTELPAGSASVLVLDATEPPTHLALSFSEWPAPETTLASDEYEYTVLLDEFFLQESSAVQTVRNKSSFSWNKDGAVLSAGKLAIFSDTSFAANTETSLVPETGKTVVSGSAKGGFTLLGIKSSGSLTASSENDEVIGIGSHSVSVPLGPFTAAEQYTTNFSDSLLYRTDSLALRGPIDAKASTTIKESGIKISREAAFSVSPAIPKTPAGGFTLSAGSIFAQTGTWSDYDIMDYSWGDLWTNSFMDALSVGEEDATKRTGTISLSAGWIRPEPKGKSTQGLTGINLETKGISNYTAKTALALGSTVSNTISVPFKIGLSTITPEWSRKATQGKVVSAGGSYITDTQFLGNSFADQPWLYTLPPIADLFYTDVAERIADSGGIYSRTFLNKYRINWKRPSSGILADLWVPSLIETSVQRDTETDAFVENIQDDYTASIQAGFTALNIAGSYGILHLFPWYQQDELSQLYTWSTDWGDDYFTWSLDTWHSIMLFFPDKATFVAENTFHYDAPSISGDDELTSNTFKIIWKYPGKDSVVSALASRLTTLQLSTTREENITVGIENNEDDIEFTTALKHILRTRIGTNGEVHLSGGVDYTRKTNGDVTINLEFGIGGTLTF